MQINEAQLDRELVQRFGFYEFVKLAFKQVTKTKFIESKHIEVICDYCEDILYGKVKRSVINIPPSSGKSTIVSILFPVYAWIQDPSLKIISVSYSPELASSFAYKSLELINSEWFKDRWSVGINNWKKVAKTDYWTDRGGRRFSTSKGSIFTGIHADIILLDDLNKASDTKNNYADTVKWCKETLPTRLVDQRTGRMVCIAQRLQPYDVCDYFINELDWNSLILPMEFVKVNADPLDWRKKDGELLSPRMDDESLKSLKLALGDFAFAQLQQDPVDMSKAIFKEELFKFSDHIPDEFDEIIVSVDSAVYAKESSDFSAAVLAGKLGDDIYIFDDWQIKKDFSDLCEHIEDYFNKKKSEYKFLKVIIEDKALGAALVDQLKKSIDVEEYKIGTKSKQERAHSVTHLFRSGNVYFYNTSSTLTDQLKKFPNVKNDDLTDAVTQALSYLGTKTESIYDYLSRMNKE